MEWEKGRERGRSGLCTGITQNSQKLPSGGATRGPTETGNANYTRRIQGNDGTVSVTRAAVSRFLCCFFAD